MGASAVVVVLVGCFFLFATTPRAAAATTASTADVVSATPTPAVCANSGALVMLGEPLPFCGNTGISCCDTVDDEALREELLALRISDATCAAIVKSFLCTRCIPSLSSVFSSADPTTATELLVPLLCPSAQAAQQQPVISAGTTSMCLESVSAASFDAMTAHPDGSGRVFLTSRDGKLWLATMPVQGEGTRAAALRIDDGGSARRPRPFLDLTDRVHIHHHDDGVLGGVMGVAFHRDFTTNGRFFVSYICDVRSVSPSACGGAGNRFRPSRYHLVVAEFSAQGGAGADFSKASRADPSEVRRIFTLGLPQPKYKLYSYQRHGGQILFRPSESDGYLYLITGYGYFSNEKNQSDGSLFGKILRFNVDNGPGGSEWPDTDRHLKWTGKPEVFAAGLSNPSGCNFDSDRPSHLLCADVNEQRSERIYLITNQVVGRRSSSPGVSVVVNHGRPADGRMPSIVGGLVYRGSADPSLNGRYIYVYASTVWSGRHASAPQVFNVSCSWRSPVQCRSSGIGSGNNGNGIGRRVLSMAEDNSKDVFFLTTTGVFRLVPSGACGAHLDPQPLQQSPGTYWLLFAQATAVLLALYLVVSRAGGQLNLNCCNQTFNFNN